MLRLRIAFRIVHREMAGTMLGTGLGSRDRKFGPTACRLLNANMANMGDTNGDEYEPWCTPEDGVKAATDFNAIVGFSSALRRVAVRISKICNDLRMMSSGPRCGLKEINLPEMQPGSSIMPGKVNPVIPEAMSQVHIIELQGAVVDILKTTVRFGNSFISMMFLLGHKHRLQILD